MSEKTWGGEPFWGLGYEWDPDWFLTERQKELRAKLIELCEKEMRANAKRSDDELLYPRRNFEILAENGFLALTVPEEYGGLGENHVAYTMVCETLARYGCASTAMCYVMHIGAVNTICSGPPLADRQYIRPLGSGKIGRSPIRIPRPLHFCTRSRRLKPRTLLQLRNKSSWRLFGLCRLLLVQRRTPTFSGYDYHSVFVIDGTTRFAARPLDSLGLRATIGPPRCERRDSSEQSWARG